MKNAWIRWSLSIAAFFVMVAGGAAGGYYFMVYRPTQQLMTLALSKTPVDPTQLREVCHRVISTPWGNAHDAFIALAKCGDASSIPYLVRALRWQSPPFPDGNMDCQTAHCLHALYVLTGQKFGYDPARWEQWWKDNKTRYGRTK